MLPGVVDLELYRGDTARYQFVLWQDANKTIPFDLTGSVPAAQIRDRADSGRVVVQLACSIALPNTVNVALLAADSAALPANCRGVWDLQITAASGDVTTVVAGNVAVTSDVTRGVVAFVPGPPAVLAGPVRPVYPASGDTISLFACGDAVHVASGPLAALTVRLPSAPTLGCFVEISFAHPIAALVVTDGVGFPVSGAPSSGYGPGAALQFRYVDASVGWAYWK
jgi:hypothetical protein